MMQELRSATNYALQVMKVMAQAQALGQVMSTLNEEGFLQPLLHCT